jgi:hypothetical protein
MIKMVEDFSDYANIDVTKEPHLETFITKNDLNANDDFRNMVLALYFSFTTLSTVGFGDFAPVSNFERVIGSIIMVFGVTLFSIIMGDFVTILN